MENKIVFVHSAGPQTDTEGSTGILNKLTKTLHSTHTIVAPDMPNPEDPSYAEWAEDIGIILSDLDHVILIGHSLGGSALLKYLSEQRPKINIRALYIISSPMWGLDEEWQKADFMLEKGFEKSLPPIKHLALYHSEYDSVVPLEHHFNYKEILNADETEIFEGDSHIFLNGLPDLVRSIQALKE
ncbi:alpha/beta hydrolase [Salinicoccus sp. HZC-1]|uniref:alpha/beta hydrolase n=1 Tax=Salinicoccus sp. HZC-1 TaxID=3385497 RepID=UPI00398A95AE